MASVPLTACNDGDCRTARALMLVWRTFTSQVKHYGTAYYQMARGFSVLRQLIGLEDAEQGSLSLYVGRGLRKYVNLETAKTSMKICAYYFVYPITPK